MDFSSRNDAPWKAKNLQERGFRLRNDIVTAGSKKITITLWQTFSSCCLGTKVFDYVHYGVGILKWVKSNKKCRLKILYRRQLIIFILFFRFFYQFWHSKVWKISYWKFSHYYICQEFIYIYIQCRQKNIKFEQKKIFWWFSRN